MIHEIRGYTVFLVECSDKSYFSGMCENLDQKLRDIHALREPYFARYRDLIPVKVVFREDHIPFREAYAKHTYLRYMTRRYRDKLVKTQTWPLGKKIRKYLKNKD